MKRLTGILLLITSIQPTLAQDFDGIYRGDLFSKDNVITLRVKKSAAAGVLFTSATDKYDFQGVIKGKEINGTIAAINWTLSGTLIGDSLSITMTSGQQIKQALFLRISSNPKKNVPEMIASFSRDERLIGKWMLVKLENSDGSQKKIDERFVGIVRIYAQDGFFYTKVPYLERTLENFSSIVSDKPMGTWTTEDSKLTERYTMVGGKPPKSTPYEIRGDTLIIVTINEKSFSVRKK
jgi:hypothetical protein